MVSIKLTDCVTSLANAWLDIRDTYEKEHPENVLVVTCTYRSPEEQTRLYHIGRHQIGDGSWIVDMNPPGQIVTQLDGVKKKSKHNSNPSAAIDFDIRVYGKTSERIIDYLIVGSLAVAHGLRWGGTWGDPPDRVWEHIKAGRFVDSHHIELP